jgi:hypothetical protein
MMNSFWLDFVCIFAMIISINSQACNWTSCAFGNQAQCAPGYVEKSSAFCDVSLYLVTCEDKVNIKSFRHI